MYPASELAALQRRKIVLRQRIAVTRLECVALAAHAARPLHWVDRVIVLWRRISPLAKVAIVPLGLLFRRRVFRRRTSSNSIGRVLRWLPLVLRGVRLFQAHRAGVRG